MKKASRTLSRYALPPVTTELTTPMAKPSSTMAPTRSTRSLPHELQEDPGRRKAAGDDQRLGVAAHVLAYGEVGGDGERAAEDDAGQVLAHRGKERRAVAVSRGRQPLGPRPVRFHRKRVPAAVPAAIACRTGVASSG